MGWAPPAEVTERFDASLLYLGCGITDDGGLELAGGVLEAEEIAAVTLSGKGGIAVLPTVSRGTARLADALLVAGFTSVIGFREPAPGMTSLVQFMLFTQLVDLRGEPAQAVAAVSRWLADPHRTYPDHLPPWLTPSTDAVGGTGPADPGVLVCHGI